MFHRMLTLPAWKYTYIVYLKASQSGLVSGNSFSRSVVVLMRASPSEANKTCDSVDAKKSIDSNYKCDFNRGVFQPLSLGKAEA